MLVLALMTAAFVLFVLAAVPVPTRFGLVPAGLACWVLAEIILRWH